MNLPNKIKQFFTKKTGFDAISGVDPEYVNLAIRTEGDYSHFIQTLEENPRFIMWMTHFLEAVVDDLALASDMKRYAMYGKKIPIIEDLIAATNDTSEEFGVSLAVLRERMSDRTFLRLFHAAIGQYTECIEKFQYLQDYLRSGKLDKTNAGEEAGDTFWYSAIEADALNVSPALIAKTNITKLMIRYDQKFSSEKASQRDLKAELQALREAFEDGDNLD